MKHLKSLLQTARTFPKDNKLEYQDILWKVICYSPKMPVRLQQQQLLDEAEKQVLQVFDPHFAKSKLTINSFRWGKGRRKVLLTHGWGSKAIDFFDLITRLKSNPELEIIAFDAPGNGSSEGELSNLLLYIESVKQIILAFGSPDILIGHSLGAMANIIAAQEVSLKPQLLLSIAPLIRLKENFQATLGFVEAPLAAQDEFFSEFENLFHTPASYFNLVEVYQRSSSVKSIVFYDPADVVHPDKYLQDFLNINPEIVGKSYPNVGHDKIIKDKEVINDIEEALL
ncbi:alpha/beta hydrolase [Desertivirga xinjiangensis]|uniref:alpha/beta hydrolase n=1 Tax=Desertivirga xinjiangensis TaxID=539206 RepID=UPI002108C886|nr:alpha/beta hydrolase [Pedobacter xinjiangensis]